jgi:hypothetical protein
MIEGARALPGLALPGALLAACATQLRSGSTATKCLQPPLWRLRDWDRPRPRDESAERPRRDPAPCSRCPRREMEPAPRVSGTSAPKFPNRCISAHIPAHFYSGPLACASGNPCKVQHSQRAALGDLPNCHAEGRGFESHQPLRTRSRSRAGFRRFWGRKGEMEPSPPIASILGTSSQNDADARRLAAISLDSASLCASGGATVSAPT